MFEDLIHRRVYEVEIMLNSDEEENIRTFAVYNKPVQEFIITYNNMLVGYVTGQVTVVEELSLEVPQHIPLETVVAECKRHCRKLVHTSLQAKGGQGWVHYDDRQPCNEQVSTEKNTILLEFLMFLHTIGTPSKYIS